jgi:membrane protease YdiL (CAAX protease family)
VTHEIIADHDRASEASPRQVLPILVGYLVLLASAELAVTFVNPLLVFPFHGGLILMAAAHLSILERRASAGRERLSPLAPMLVVFVVAPLIRLISLMLPLAQIAPPYRYAFAGAAMTVAAVVAARSAGYGLRAVGLVFRRWRWQVAVVVVSIALGILEYKILRPDPLGELPWAGGLVPALSVAVFTGFPEELIFRGILQTAARPLLVRWTVLYASAVFAVLHIGYQSLIDLAFVFGVGVIYGYVFERTRSIIGVSIGHGVANAILFFVAPNVAGLAGAGLLP